MKKLAIVSSYNIHCGNASYAEALRKEFSKFYDVTMLAVDVNLLRNKFWYQKTIRKLAKNHVNIMALELRNFDYVNIQLEFNLYGLYPHIALTRIKNLITNSKNTILTIHRIDNHKSFSDIKSILTHLLLFKFNLFMKGIKEIIRSYIYYKCTQNLLNFCKLKNVKIIVHTEREKLLVKNTFNFQRVSAYPITFLNKNEIQFYKSKASLIEFKKKYSIPHNAITIGIFGFVSEYKGHLFTIKMMEILPKNYHLLIFGTVHPHTLQREKESNHYLNKLMSIAHKNENNCVHFLGELNNDDFINAIICCDYNLLPYHEIGQSGSGIAALSLELASKSIMSNNHCFKELQKYAKNCFKTFNMGNYHELAKILKNYDDNHEENLKKYRDNYNIEKNILLHKKLFEEENRVALR